jgi:hypothetical protein
MSKVEASAVERIIANTISERRGAIPTPWPPASSPLWPKQAIVSFRPTGERTPHHAPRGQSRDSSIGAQTGIAGSSSAIPRPARPSSGTRRMRHQAVR